MLRSALFSLVLVATLLTTGAVAYLPADEADHPPSTPVLPGSYLVPSLVDAPDALAWSRDPATGLEFRHASALERALNGWEVGAVLVEEGSVADARAGADTVTLLLPLPDGALPARFDRLTTFEGAPVGWIDADGAASMRVPLLHGYVARTEGVAGFLVVEDGGGYYGRAFRGDLQAEITGPEPARQVLPLPGADGAAPSPDDLALVSLMLAPGGADQDAPMDHCGIYQFLCDIVLGRDQCRDGIDNDGDGWVDYPNDPGCSSSNDNSEAGESRATENLVLLGEGKWCTRNSANWVSLVNTIGSEIGSAYDGNGGTRADVNHIYSFCITFVNQATANQCDTSGGCTMNYDGSAYPYNGCNSGAECYRDRAWGHIPFWRKQYSFASVHDVQVLHDGTMSSNTLCGLASFSSGGPYFGSSSGPAPSGDSVSAGYPKPSNCVNYIPTHETGHTFDAIHGNAQNISNCLTVMAAGNASPACRYNYFSNANRKNINNCEFGSYASSCPRNGSG